MSFQENYYLQRRQYLPAVLKNIPSRGWLIEYYILDQESNSIKRKAIGLNVLAKRYKNSIAEFRAYANTIVAQINSQLAQCVLSVNESAVERVHQNVMFVGKMNNKPTVMMVVPQQKQASAQDSCGWYAPVVGKTDVHEQPKEENVAKIEKKVESKTKKAKVVSRMQMSLSEVIELYLAEKTRELRKDTLRSYNSFCKMFDEWCSKNVAKKAMSEFDNEIIMRFLDYVYDERKVSARTYNNQLKMGRALFSWAKEKCYVKENPFENAKVKRTEEKKRILVPAETRKEITDYFEKTNNLAMLTICRLVFASAIRPKEIRNIRVRDVIMSKKVIRIPAENAKNHHERFATINDQIFNDLLRMHLDGVPDDYYLFGKDMCPGIEICGDSKYTKEWDKMRKALNLPQEMQLYSLRDTGLNNLLKNGVDALTVMQHADHHDLSMTTRYANHADPNLAEKIFNSSVEF